LPGHRRRGEKYNAETLGFAEKSGIFATEDTEKNPDKGKSFGSRDIVYFRTSTSSNGSAARCKGILRQIRSGSARGNPE
jgi:hypothetical protein